MKKSQAKEKKFDDNIVRVRIIELIGKRKRKTTNIEIKRSELDEMIKKSGKQIYVQFLLF